LRECLLLQLERAGRTESLEYRIVRDFMDALASGASGNCPRHRLLHRRSAGGHGPHRAFGTASGRAYLPDANHTYCPKFLCKSPATIML